ncbi:tyrosine-protein phosphatase [Enterococcus sp. LJL120]
MNINDEHFIRLNGTFNTRDFGGYQTEGGRRIKKGKLFRSDDLFLLTNSDIEILEKYGINTIIDYRNQSERSKRPNQEIAGAKTYVLSPDSKIAALASSDLKTDFEKVNSLIQLDVSNQLNLSSDMLKESMLSYVKDKHSQGIYKEMLTILGRGPNIISLQHCRGGKDRTGYGVALVLLLLGVEEETIIEDYMATGKYNQTRNDERMAEYRQYTDNKNVLNYLESAMATREDVIYDTIIEIKKVGGTVIDYFRKVMGLSEDFIQRFKEYYLEDMN